MKQLRYASAVVPLRLEYPGTWDPSALSALTATVLATDGTTLAVAAAATRYTSTTLGAAVSAFAQEVTLATGATALKESDPILIKGALGDERRFVKGYNSTSRVVELNQILDHAHDSGDVVYGLFATINLDLSVTATFTKGIVLTVVWTPTGTGAPLREQYQVSQGNVDLQALRNEFRYYCPRAYDAFIRPEDRFDEMVAMAERQVKKALLAHNPPLDYYRVVDQEELRDPLMSHMAKLWVQNGDEKLNDERKYWQTEAAAQLQILLASSVWTDGDQDDIEDEGETTTHEPIFDRGW